MTIPHSLSYQKKKKRSRWLTLAFFLGFTIHLLALFFAWYMPLSLPATSKSISHEKKNFQVKKRPLAPLKTMPCLQEKCHEDKSLSGKDILPTPIPHPESFMSSSILEDTMPNLSLDLEPDCQSSQESLLSIGETLFQEPLKDSLHFGMSSIPSHILEPSPSCIPVMIDEIEGVTLPKHEDPLTTKIEPRQKTEGDLLKTLFIKEDWAKDTPLITIAREEKDFSYLRSEADIRNALIDTQTLTSLWQTHRHTSSLFSDESKQERQESKGTAKVATSDDSTLTLEYAKKKDQGYLFRLILHPKPRVNFKRIAQNVFFLIDRSHSIAKERYILSKKAVAQALEILDPQDTFNILIFDDMTIRLFEQNQRASRDNLLLAKDFLQHLPYGGLFAKTDLYQSLDRIIPSAVADTEVNTAILISDGDTYLDQGEQKRMIGLWTLKNRGKVSLFSVACGKDNNLPLLSILSALNKGLLLYQKDPLLLDVSLINFMGKIKNPIAKDIHVRAITTHPTVKIEIFPSVSRLPDMYEEIPYTLYGSVNELHSFYLHLQGKYYQKLLQLKYAIDFHLGKEVELQTIEKDLALEKAYEEYETYLMGYQ